MKTINYVLIIVFFLLSSSLYSQLYIGGGINYLMPMEKFADYNKDAIGYNIQLENRQFCKLWYGLRINYTKFEPQDEQIKYFETIAELTPQIKYAPFTNNCYDNKIIPYIYANLSISSITATDELSKIGIGAGIGIGIAFNFKLFQKCWMIELNSIYSAPNTIYRADAREKLNMINSGITLSIGL